MISEENFNDESFINFTDNRKYIFNPRLLLRDPYQPTTSSEARG